MGSSSEDFDLQGVYPEDHGLPSTHVVSAVKDRYIRAHILHDFLQEKWENNGGATVISKLSYHIYIAPKVLREDEIRKLARKTEKQIKKEADERRKTKEKKDKK